MNRYLFSIANAITIMILALTLPGCGAVQYGLPTNYIQPVPGEISTIFSGTTTHVIQDALAGKPGTQIWSLSDRFFVFAKGTNYGQMFYAWDAVKGRFLNSGQQLCGNLVCYTTYKDLANFMRVQGFQITRPDALSTLIKAAIAVAIASATKKPDLAALFFYWDEGVTIEQMFATFANMNILINGPKTEAY